MKRRHVILGTTAVGSFLLGTAICLVLRPGPNLLRNPDFEWGLEHWGWYVDTKAGTQATFTAEPARGARGSAARISVTEPSYYDSVEFRQGDLAVTASRRYTVRFRARSTVMQALRIKIIKDGEPWTFSGFRAATEVTPSWRWYRLTGRVMNSLEEAKLMFQCGGAVGDIWIDDVSFRERTGQF